MNNYDYGYETPTSTPPLEDIKVHLQEEIDKPLSSKRAEPAPGTSKHIVYSNYHELTRLREKAKLCRKQGLGNRYSWRELAGMLSTLSGKHFSGDYLRKLYYQVSEEFFSEE